MATIVFSAVACAAVEPNDPYCDSVTEQARAQRDQLRSLSLISGFDQPVSGQPVQMYWGLRNSLGDDRKATLVMRAAASECALHRTAEQAELHVHYALSRLERAALQHRIELIQHASAQLNQLVEQAERSVAEQTLTRPAMYPLLASRVRLSATKADAVAAMAAYIPEMDDVPLSALIDQKRELEREHQKALNAVQAQSNWNATWSVGARSQAGQFWSSAPQPYGELSVSYNLFSRSVSRHLDRAAKSFVAWSDVHEGDSSRQASALEKQLSEILSLQQKQLEALQEEAKEIKSNLKLLDSVASNSATTFRNQLLADRILLMVDVGDVSYRIAIVGEFLQSNF